VNAAQHLQQLAALTLGTLGGALGVGQQQASHFQYEDQQLTAFEAKAGVSGRLQAIQVTNEILLAQAQQLQLLRQLLMCILRGPHVLEAWPSRHLFVVDWNLHQLDRLVLEIVHTNDRLDQ
jgi:hypothetical protein